MDIRELKDKALEHYYRHEMLYKGIAIGAGATLLVVGAVHYRSLYVLTKNGGAGALSLIASDEAVVNAAGRDLYVIQQLKRRGHPGYVVRCNETGETFASINRAATMNDISPSTIRNQICGRIPNAKGLTFTKLGEAVS